MAWEWFLIQFHVDCSVWGWQAQGLGWPPLWTSQVKFVPGWNWPSCSECCISQEMRHNWRSEGTFALPWVVVILFDPQAGWSWPLDFFQTYWERKHLIFENTHRFFSPLRVLNIIIADNITYFKGVLLSDGELVSQAAFLLRVSPDGHGFLWKSGVTFAHATCHLSYFQHLVYYVPYRAHFWHLLREVVLIRKSVMGMTKTSWDSQFSASSTRLFKNARSH